MGNSEHHGEPGLRSERVPHFPVRAAPPLGAGVSEPRNECLARGSKLYDHLPGFNSFSASFVTGFGYWNALPGHGPAREDTTGMVQPGYPRFGTQLANTLLAEYADAACRNSYRMTEDLIMESAALFPILGLLDSMQGAP